MALYFTMTDANGSSEQLTLFDKAEDIAERLGDVAFAVRHDYRKDPNKVKMLGIAAGTAALQVADRLRASVVFVPTIAVNVLQNTHSPAEAAVAGGGAFAAWCAAVGGATAESLDQYPCAVKTAEDKFPGVVGFFQDALPGFDAITEEQKAQAVPKRIGRRLLTGLTRGFTVSGIGSVAYVSAASVKGRPKKEVHKLNLNASADGGMAVGTIVLAAGEAIVRIGETNPALAEKIQHDASNIKLWYGVAGLLIAQNFITNKLKQRRLRRASPSETTETISANEELITTESIN